MLCVFVCMCVATVPLIAIVMDFNASSAALPTGGWHSLLAGCIKCVRPAMAGSVTETWSHE